MSESIVSAIVSDDPSARTDIETLIFNDDRKNILCVGGNVSFNGFLRRKEVLSIIESLAKDIGYARKFGFDTNDFRLVLGISRQSQEIKKHITAKKSADSRICSGYACTETPSFLPLSVVAAEKISKEIDAQFRNGELNAGPDGKVQVHCAYNNGAPEVESVTVHVQAETGEKRRIEEIVKEVVPDTRTVNVLAFKNGLFRADKGVSNTKLLCYGEALPHGGGGPWGKDMSKVEKFGLIAARSAAIKIARKENDAFVSLAYSMSKESPDVYTENGTAVDKKNLRPEHIIKTYGSEGISSRIIKNGLIGYSGHPWEARDL